MFGSTPYCSQAKLSVRVEIWCLEDFLLWMEKLTNEWVIGSGLPLLDEGHVKTSIVCSVCVDWDWSPNVQVVVVLPVS